jgi:signal transduction histidine kinase
MLPKVVLHKKNGHSSVPNRKGLSAGEMLRLVHSGQRPPAAPAMEMVQFANIVRTEKVQGLEEQVRQSIDSMRAALVEALRHTEEAFARGELDDVRERLEALRDQAERAARLITAVVNAARARSSSRRVLNLNDLLTRAARGLTPGFPATLTWAFQLDPELPRVIADPRRLADALTALLRYVAMETSAAGTGTITVETARAEAVVRGEHLVLVHIVGTGPLDADAMQRAFLPPPLGALLDRELAPPAETDLGLAFRIVTDHGGVLTASNWPAGGACFTLTLPAA